MKQQLSLKQFVYRILVRRLIVTAVIVSAIFSAITYYRTHGTVTDTVIKVAGNRMAVVRGRFNELMSRGDMPLREVVLDAVSYPPESRIQLSEGEFVHVRLFDRSGKQLVAYSQKEFPALSLVNTLASDLAPRYPESGQLVSESTEIGGRPFLTIFARMAEAEGKRPAIFLQAVFALSDQTIASVRWQTIKTAGYVIIIVFGTTLLLFPVITNLTSRLAVYSVELLDANLEILEVLGGAIAKRDSDTDAHNYRVTLYAVRLAETIGLPESSMQSLIKGSFLHDVGKLGIRDDILLKPGRLDEDEFAIMKTHVQHGQDIILRSKWLRDSEDVVARHHEKYGGRGYPAGSSSEEIPLVARIFAIADVFDALTSKRPYKEPLSYEETMKILEEGRGNHFDPRLLDRFSEISRVLYDKFCGRDDDGLKQQLKEVTRKYFQGGLDTLKY